jgi:predicted nucleotidyltransferase
MSTSNAQVKKRFTEALDDLIAQVKRDRSILAAILCGSLAHDVVWENSDIDLALITIDDKKVEAASLALYAGGLNVHAFLMPRAEFRKTVEGAVGNSFTHSLLAKGTLLYTHDETIAHLCARLREIGERDRQVALLAAATTALPSVYKAHKWFITRGDLDYTALWILYAANSLARVEVIGAHLLADREVMIEALKLNPAFFKTVYSDLLNTKKTRISVQEALDAMDAYLAQRAEALFRPVLDYLREAAEARSSSEIDAWFRRHFDVACVSAACEYLADRGLIGKVSTPVQITKKSNVTVEELAFVYLGETLSGEPPDEF